MNHKINSNSLSKILAGAIARTTHYFDGSLHPLQQEKQLPNRNGENTLTTQSKGRGLVVVARHLYKEFAKEYPIESKGALSKVLNLEYSEQPNVRYRVWKIEGGKAYVNVWHFDESVPQAICLIPESLVWASLAYKESCQGQGQETTSVAISQYSTNGKKCYSSIFNHMVYSANDSSLINSAAQFAMASGLPYHGQEHSYLVKGEQGLARQQLISGIRSLSMSTLASLLKPIQQIDKFSLIKSVSIPVFAVLIVYLATTSIYLTYKHSRLEQALNEQNDKVSAALDMQIRVDEKQLRYQVLSKFLAEQSNFSSGWLPVFDVFKLANIRNVQTSAERIVIRGSALDAVAILELVTQHPLVRDAKFDFPVRKNRNRDTFVISFALKDEISMEAIVDTEVSDSRRVKGE